MSVSTNRDLGIEFKGLGESERLVWLNVSMNRREYEIRDRLVRHITVKTNLVYFRNI